MTVPAQTLAQSALVPPRTRSARETLLLLGTPIVLGVLTALHPVIDRDPVAELGAGATLWLAIHAALLPATALLGAAMWLLVRDLPGRAARVTRCALPVFFVFYGAFEGMAGTATGLMVREAATLPAAAETARAIWQTRLANPWFGLVVVGGNLAWLTAAVGAAFAHRRAGSGPLVAGGLVVAGLLLAIDHAPPFGPLAMLGVLVAAGALVRTGR